jgi:hypothetical protein
VRLVNGLEGRHQPGKGWAEHGSLFTMPHGRYVIDSRPSLYNPTTVGLN